MMFSLHRIFEKLVVEGEARSASRLGEIDSGRMAQRLAYSKGSFYWLFVAKNWFRFGPSCNVTGRTKTAGR